MVVEIELLPIDESKRFRISCDSVIGSNYYSPESETICGYKVSIEELAYHKQVDFNRIKEYEDKLSEPDKVIVRFFKYVAEKNQFSALSRKQYLSVLHSNLPEIKTIREDVEKEGELRLSVVKILRNHGIEPGLYIKTAKEMQFPPGLREYSFISARNYGKVKYLENHEDFVKQIRELGIELPEL